MVAALMANGGDDGVRARWKSEGEEQAGEKDLEGCRRGLGDSSLSPRRCGGVGRRAGPAGTARGVRPRSVEQTRRGEDDKGRGEVLGRWTDSAGWASGPRPLGSRGVFFPFALFFIYFPFLFYF